MISDTRLPAEAKAPLLSAFLKALPNAAAGPPQDEAAHIDAFVEAIAADYKSEELPGVSLADVAHCAAELWTFAQSSVGSGPAIRVTPAKSAVGEDLDADLVEIVQPDAPFLVDSVMGELIEAGASVM
ncbi:MAG TPA: hypothetical protein VHX64_04615, partial [Caulobacteraceae bacterium]|nr:hypothetical protein [Caulobacteraceae bacterium]